MSTDRTAQQWLTLGDDLAVELAKVFTPGPRKHDFPEMRDLYRPFIINAYGPCRKCRRHRMDEFTNCHLPDRIKIDWNTAMEWFRKVPLLNIINILAEVSNAAIDDVEDWQADEQGEVNLWFLIYAQPKHYLIAAAMAAGRGEE